jgi:predicted transcriptional regulator of viral defense system
LEKGDLIRVKKGLYLFGSDYRKGPYSPEIMANKIYGPSYVSREYALAYFGLIPEYVTEVTSVSTKRSRNFDTPIGRFSYVRLPLKLYQVNFDLISVRNNETALFATPEKALADLLYFRDDHPETLNELVDLLFDDLRLDDALVSRMRIGMFNEILKAGGSPTIKLIIEWIRGQK